MKKIKFLTLGIVMTVSALTASAQKWGATPEDSVACITSKFLYNEDYKNMFLWVMGQLPEEILCFTNFL